MKRRLFNILSALSLLLCVATMVLWILNIWVVTEWEYRDPDGVPFSGRSSHGCIEVDYVRSDLVVLRQPHIYRAPGFHVFFAADSGGFPWKHVGFDVRLLKFPTFAATRLEVLIPDWFICSITAILPWLWYRSHRRRRLAQCKGLCLKCGYDLRASKDHCPECGTLIPAQTEASINKTA